MNNSTTLSYWEAEPMRGIPTLDQPFEPKPKYILESPTNSSNVLTSEYVAGLDEEFAKHFAKLKAIETNRTLWPENADTPSMSSIAWTRTILQHFVDVEFAPARVVASAEGGVALCFMRGDKYADVECLNTGEILGVTSNRHDRPVVWEIEQNVRSLAMAAIRIREFFRAPTTGKNVPAREKSR